MDMSYYQMQDYLVVDYALFARQGRSLPLETGDRLVSHQGLLLVLGREIRVFHETGRLIRRLGGYDRYLLQEDWLLTLSLQDGSLHLSRHCLVSEESEHLTIRDHPDIPVILGMQHCLVQKREDTQIKSLFFSSGHKLYLYQKFYQTDSLSLLYSSEAAICSLSREDDDLLLFSESSPFFTRLCLATSEATQFHYPSLTPLVSLLTLEHQLFLYFPALLVCIDLRKQIITNKLSLDTPLTRVFDSHFALLQTGDTHSLASLVRGVPDTVLFSLDNQFSQNMASVHPFLGEFWLVTMTDHRCMVIMKANYNLDRLSGAPCPPETRVDYSRLPCLSGEQLEYLKSHDSAQLKRIMREGKPLIEQDALLALTRESAVFKEEYYTLLYRLGHHQQCVDWLLNDQQTDQAIRVFLLHLDDLHLSFQTQTLLLLFRLHRQSGTHCLLEFLALFSPDIDPVILKIKALDLTDSLHPYQQMPYFLKLLQIKEKDRQFHLIQKAALQSIQLQKSQQLDSQRQRGQHLPSVPRCSQCHEAIKEETVAFSCTHRFHRGCIDSVIMKCVCCDD